MSDKARKNRYNLRDVASHAGVSVATVSRVLNASSQVSPATRDRVTAAMTELRFVPSAAARAINSGRTRMVAALLPTLDNSIYSRVVDGLENRLADFGLSLIVAQTWDDQNTEFERAKELINIGAEGFIVAGITHSEDFLELMEHIQMPVVAISYFAPDNKIPTVGYDNWEAAITAAQHLHELGHRKVAAVHGHLENNDRTRRRREALENSGLPIDFEFVQVEISVAGGCEAARRVLAEHNDITGVICFSDVLAIGAMNEFQRNGLAIPDDISVMGIEDLKSSKFAYPSLTSVRLHVQEMGEKAAEAIAIWLDEQKRPDPVKLGIELNKRESTSKA